MEHIEAMKDLEAHNSVIALGNFDGIHLGHQKLIEMVQRQSQEKNLKAILFTFHPHPSFSLGEEPFSLIFTREEKKRIVEQYKLDLYVEYPFTLEMARMEPIPFVKDILCEKLGCKAVVVGENYRFGVKRSGDIQLLKSLGKEMGFEVYGISAVRKNGSRISSSKIRNYLKDGKIDIVNALLGKHYFILGRVSSGRRIGRSIGFPTVNIIPPKEKLLPKDGVYITQTRIAEKGYPSITNVGHRPTVNGKRKVIETHILDFEENLYNEEICIEFLAYKRNEKKFKDISALGQQIGKDMEDARKFFAQHR